MSFSIRIVMFKVMSEPNDEFPCCVSVFLRRCKSVIPVLHCSTVLYTVCVREENNSNPINLNFEIKRRCFFLLGFLCIKITWSPELFFQKRLNVFFPFLKLQLYLVLSMVLSSTLSIRPRSSRWKSILSPSLTVVQEMFNRIRLKKWSVVWQITPYFYQMWPTNTERSTHHNSIRLIPYHISCYDSCQQGHILPAISRHSNWELKMIIFISKNSCSKHNLKLNEIVTILQRLCLLVRLFFRPANARIGGYLTIV